MDRRLRVEITFEKEEGGGEEGGDGIKGEEFMVFGKKKVGCSLWF